MPKMHIDVMVKDSPVQAIGRTSGKAYATQAVWVDLGKAFPVEVRVLVDANTPGFAPGRYELNESALFVDRNGDLRINFRNLKPAAVAAVKAS